MGLEDKENVPTIPFISTIHRKYGIFLNHNMKDYNLSFGQYPILIRLYDVGPSTQQNLAKIFQLNESTISRALNKLEEKGYITSTTIKEGKMPEKAVYTLTDSGHHQFEKLMMEISCKPINIFLDFNAVIVNIDSLSKDTQKLCLANIESNVQTLKSYLEENMNLKKDVPEIPETGIAVLEQQVILVQAIETWLISMKKRFEL